MIIRSVTYFKINFCISPHEISLQSLCHLFFYPRSIKLLSLDAWGMLFTTLLKKYTVLENMKQKLFPSYLIIKKTQKLKHGINQA